MERVGRRTALALAGAGLLSAACGHAKPVTASRRTAIAIDPGPLFPYLATISRAWKAAAQPFDITFPAGQHGRFDLSTASANTVEEGTLSLPFDPYLRVANVAPSTFVASAAPRTWGPDNATRALPVGISQQQFYVNDHRIKGLGLANPDQWTMAGVMNAVAAALATSPDGPARLIVGTDLQPLPMWASFVLGLGGSLGPPDHLDLSGAITATAAALAFSARAGWWTDPCVGRPAACTQEQVGLAFQTGGFSGLAAPALFGFWSSWLTEGFDPTHPPAGGIATLPTRAFPAFGARRLVPAADRVDWVLPPQARHPDLAAQFVLWTYQAPQQRLLADLGWPPVVRDPSLVAYWQSLGPSRAPNFPRYDLADGIDVVVSGSSPTPFAWAWPSAATQIVHGADAATVLMQLQAQESGVRLQVIGGGA